MDESAVSTDLSAAPPLPATGEGCPTPLAWSDVVAGFLRESREATVSIDGGVVRSRSLGTGRPIYFLGNASGDGRLFALTAWLLKDEAECVVVEYPTFARRPAADEYLPRLVQALEEVRRDRGHAQVAVYGATVGGLCALEWMRRHPASISHGIVQSPTFGVPWTLLERAMLRMGRCLSRPISSLPGWKPMQERNHRDWFPPFDPTRWDFLVENLGATPVQEVALRLRASGKSLDPEIASIRQPLLIVRTEGEGAGLTRKAEELRQLVPSATVEWMHTCGHLPFLTHPHRLVKVLRQFLDER